MAKSYEQLQRQIAELQAEAEQLRQQEVAEVVARIRDAITHYGLTAADLGLSAGGAKAGSAGPSVRNKPGRKPGAKAVAKAAAKSAATVLYRDDAGRSWVGRGKRPTWLRDALAAGRKLEDFRVPPG